MDRVHDLPGGVNFRDFGGYLTNSSRLVHWLRLFRSSNLNGLTAEGQEQFSALGIRHVIDLRTQHESELGVGPALD